MMATETPWVIPCPPTAREAQGAEARAEEAAASDLGFHVNQELELPISPSDHCFCDMGEIMRFVSCLFAVFVKYIGCRTLTPLHRHSIFRASENSRGDRIFTNVLKIDFKQVQRCFTL